MLSSTDSELTFPVEVKKTMDFKMKVTLLQQVQLFYSFLQMFHIHTCLLRWIPHCERKSRFN
jgi:hypothetical protein